MVISAMKKLTTTRRWLRPLKRNAASKDNENVKNNSSERGESTTDIDIDISSNSTHSSSTGRGASNLYGHGDAGPDTAAKHDEYGDKSPEDTAAKYGYGDASPDDTAKYGYEDASPSPSSGNPTRVNRRSSMKQAGRPRRASIQFGGEIEVQLPGNEMPVKRRTSITFKENIRVRQVARVHELTHEPEALWFQNHEYKEIKENMRNTVRKTQQGVVLGDRRYCTRGLENFMTQEAAQMTREKKCMAWDSVLKEQDLQRDQGVFDDEYMANRYKYNTAKCQQDAANRASRDAADVENYLKSTRGICRRVSM
jgi:hypothetical protein